MVTGQEVARINFSANTSLDHLLGAVVPRCVDGKRTFEWQDGKVLQALRAGQWLLLDEINLASPEVLDGLARLFFMPGDSENRTLRLPSGQDIDIPLGFHVFATMNPASIGGGRSRLPRSIGNLFASVHLEESSQEELRVIIAYMFANQLEDKSISQPQLQALFDLHWTIKSMIEKSIVGRVGGPYEINLRDLAKVRDVLSGNWSDQKYHYMVNSDSQNKSSVEDVNILSLRRFAELVYASPFHSFQDQAVVIEQINKFFPLAVGLDGTRANALECDSTVTAVEGSVRIRSIYMTQGKALHLSNAATLELTKRTVSQLEMLAAAAQSKRAVLLEGDTCSRKTALVQELARITRHELLIISMNEDTETSDLIGQWLPMTAEDGTPSFRKSIQDVIRDVMKSLVLHCSDLLDREDIKKALHEVSSSFSYFHDESYASAESLRHDVERLSYLKQSLERVGIADRVSLAFRHALNGHISKISDVVERIEEVLKRTADSDSGISFSFVKSDFVKAIENGGWVLLDSINSAPSEVVERLNSLLEENPMLNLYEHAEGKVLTRKRGIHPDFRLFATANIYRKNSNKLSSAFLNRMVRIWLPQIDSELVHSKSVADTDLMEFTKMKLAGISGGHELSTVLLRFHQILQHNHTRDTIGFVTGFTLSFRCIQQTLRSMLHLVGKEVPPVRALAWAIQQNYGAAAATAAGKERICAILSAEMSRDDILLNDGEYSTLPPSPDAITSKHRTEGREFSSLMCVLETRLSQLANTVLKHLVDNPGTIHDDAIGFVVLVFENIYSHKFVNDNLFTRTLVRELDQAKIKAETPHQAAKWIVEAISTVFKCSHGLHAISMEGTQFLLRRVSTVVRQIQDKTFWYLERASFQDIHGRAVELTRVHAVLLQFMQVLKFEGDLSTNVSKNKDLQDLLREGATEVSHLLSVVSTMLTWTEAMKRRDRKLADLRLMMEHCLEDDRAAKHAFQMQLTRQIIGPPPSWPSLSTVVSSICVISDRATNEQLMPYCSMVQWEGLQFEFKLNPCCRMLAIAPPGIDFLSNGNMAKLEELWCIKQVKEKCAALFDCFARPLDLFERSWSELQSEIQAHTQTSEMQKGQRKQREKNLKDKRSRIEQLASELQDKKREVVADETERRKRDEELQKEAEKIDDEKGQVQDLMEEADTLAMQHDTEDSEMRKTFESKQNEMMKRLLCSVDDAISMMSDLKKHDCFNFLAKRHVTPGVSAASDFLEHVLSQIAGIVSARQQVSPASLELGLRKLFQSRPRLAASAIGRLLIGTFLVPNPRDQTCALLSQGMAIVSTQSEPALEHVLSGQSLVNIYFLCGSNSEDELSLCVCKLSSSSAVRNDADLLEVHHWHSHGEGSKGHVKWLDRLVSSVEAVGLKVKEHTRPLPLVGTSGMISVSSAESLANGCFLALHSLDLGHMGTSSSAVKEVGAEEAVGLCKNLESAVKRMQKLASVRDGNSDVTAAVDLVYSNLVKISLRMQQDSRQELTWNDLKQLVTQARELLDQLTSSRTSAVFSEASRDDSSKKVEEQMDKLKVTSSIDRYRAVRRLRELQKLEQFSIIPEIERRLVANEESLDAAAHEFESCDKAVQLVRKVIFVFVELLYAHVQRGSFSGDSARIMIDSSQAALTLCRELSAHALGCIDCSSDVLKIRQLADKDLLQTLAEKAEQLLKDLGVAPATAQTIDITGTIQLVFDHLRQRHGGKQSDGAVPSLPGAEANVKTKASAAKVKATSNIAKMEALLNDLRQMKPKPHKVLHNIRTFINELKWAVDRDEKESEIDKLLVKRYNPIKREVEEVRRQAKARESAWLRNFQIEGLEVIDIDHSNQDAMPMGAEQQTLIEANKAYEKLKAMSIEVAADNQLVSAKMYVSISAKMRCWQHLLEICRSLGAEHSDTGMEKMFLFSAIVSDDIALELNAAQTKMNADDTISPASVVHNIYKKIIEAYQQFRAHLMEKKTRDSSAEEWALEEIQSKMFDFESVKDVCSPIELTQSMPFGMLLPTLKSMLTRSAAVHNEIRCYPEEITFHVEPLCLRLSDALAMLFPDDLESIHHLSSAQDIFDIGLSKARDDDRRERFEEAKNARNDDRGISSVLETTEESNWLVDQFKLTEVVPLFEKADVQQIFRESRDMAFDLFDKLIGYFTDPKTETRSVLNIFDSSDQIPPWQIALSLSLFSTANSLLSTMYRDSSSKHRDRILPHIQLVENEHNHELFRVDHDLMTCREKIKRLEEKKCQLEEDFRFEQNQYRLNAFRNDDGGRIKHELDQCIKGLKEHQDALKGLSKQRKDAEETYERKLRTRQGELLDKICKELADIGKSFCSFVEKVVPIIKNRDGVDEVLGRFSGGSNQQV
jgi:MoxR-like ATPase